MASRVCASFGVLCVSLFILTWWINSTFLDPARFRTAIESTLASPQLTAPFADSLEKSLAQQMPPGVASPEQLSGAVNQVLQDPAFTATVADVVSSYVAAATTDAPREQPALSLQEFRPALVQALAAVSPEAAASVPEELGSAQLPAIADVPSFAEEASTVRTAPWFLLVAAALLFVLAMVASADRPRTLRRIGIGLLLTSALPLALRFAGPTVVRVLVPSTDAAMRAMLANVTGDLMIDWVRAALWVTAAGVLTTGFAVLWIRRANATAQPGPTAPFGVR